MTTCWLICANANLMRCSPLFLPELLHQEELSPLSSSGCQQASGPGAINVLNSVFITAPSLLTAQLITAHWTAHCTLSTVYCTLHTAHFTLHTAYCILHTAHCTLQTAQTENATLSTTANFTRYSAHGRLHPTHCTLHTQNYTLHTYKLQTAHYKLDTAHYTCLFPTIIALTCSSQPLLPCVQRNGLPRMSSTILFSAIDCVALYGCIE